MNFSFEKSYFPSAITFSAPILGTPSLTAPPFGRAPDTSSANRSPSLPACHPSGISPSSESMKSAGKRSAIGLGRPGSRPSALAQTGSKSTNHDLNSARAIASSVSLVRRFSSILSSSAPRIRPIACCSLRAGSSNQNERIRDGEVCFTVLPVALAITSLRYSREQRR
jgi:hypothetical protein